MKSFFMNEIYNLRKEMNDMKDEIQNGNKGNEKSNTLSNVDLITTLKTQNSFLEQENLFIKSELKHQQKIIDKLLDIRSDNCSDQLKSNQSVKEYKKDFNKIKLDDRKELKDTGKPEQNKGKPNVNQNNHENNNRKSNHARNNKKYLSSDNNKKKVTLIGDSMVKYLRSDELSSNDTFVQIKKHSGYNTADMLDFVKPVIRRKPDLVLFHSGTNDLTDELNTMKKVKKLVKVVRELDSEQTIQLGFSSIIVREDQNYSTEIKEVNDKLKRYCVSKNFLFVDNGNLNGTCLNNSKLHLNRKGSKLFSENIKKCIESL